MDRVRIREAEIEDVLATYPQILRETIAYDSELSLIARQKELPSGRLDLLLVSRNQLFLVELKVEPYRTGFLDQITAYRDDLLELQKHDALVGGEISSFLLVTSFGKLDKEECEKKNVALVSYQPAEVLRSFYNRLAGLSVFLSMRPKDYGIWNIHIVNRVVYELPHHNKVMDISQSLRMSPKTARNHLLFAALLGLVSRLEERHLLTDLGRQYLESRERSLSDYLLSDSQTKLLREHIAKDPFASNVVFGIYSIVEAVFTLARNSYPVRMEQLINYYRDSVGKRYDWKTDRSAFGGATSFSNFAVELGLLGAVGDNLLLTPAGFRFIIMLQLHKGIRMVDALGWEAIR